MAKFILNVVNGVATLPDTLGVENVENKLLVKRGGMVHVVAYTNAKALKGAREMGLDLVKITDIMVVMGNHKEEPRNAENGENRAQREPIYSHITDTKGRGYYEIQHTENGTKYFVGFTTNNPKHRAKSYYVDRNTGRVYTKQYLVENRLISSARTSESSRFQFNLDNVISI